jgi:hypothetical protein
MGRQVYHTGPNAVPGVGPGSSAGSGFETAKKRDVRSAGRPEFFSIVLYFVLALGAYLPVLPGQSGQVPWCACDDTAQSIWFLRWTPFALIGDHTLLTSNWIDVGSGVNLVRNTSMPLLGLLAAPITLLNGPVAAFNVLLWLGVATSGTACFLVLRRAVTWTPAAFAGGLIYAFSSYMAGQGLGHLNLVFVPIPPMLMYVLYELLVLQRHSARRWGIGLGLLAAAQFLISAEILIDSAVIGVIGILILVLAHPSLVGGRLKHALIGGVWALAGAAPFVAYPLDVYFRGPQRFSGSPWHGSTFPMDLLGTVVPTMNQRLTTAGWAAVGDRLQPNLTENGAYLGIPLVLLLVFFVVRYRHVVLMRFAAAMAVVAWLLSLGPHLTVNGRQTAVPLPFDLFAHLPVLNSILAGRFTLFIDLFAGCVVAVGMNHLRTDLGKRKGFSEVIVASLITLLMMVALLPVLPRWPYPHVPVTSTTPTFFTTDEVDVIPSGGAVLTFPYPVYPENQAMLWQAVSSMRFRILGGYALIPGAGNAATDGPAAVTPATVPTTLIADYSGLPNPGPAATPADLRALVAQYGIVSLIVGPGGVDPAAAVALFTQTYGAPQVIGGVQVWTHLT